MLLAVWVRWRRPTELPDLRLPCSGNRIISSGTRTNFDFLGKRKIALILSTVDQRRCRWSASSCSASTSASTSRAASPSRCAPSRATVHLDELRSTVGDLGVGEVSLQEFGDNSTALIRVQRQEGNAAVRRPCRRRSMKRRAGNGWASSRAPADTGDVEFTAPGALDAAGWRDAVSRVGLTVQERQLPRGTTNTAKIDMTPEQRAEWCQQVAIKLVEDAIGGKYELRGTESVGPKIGEELMHSGIWRRAGHPGRHRGLCLVPLRMAVRRRRADRPAARRASRPSASSCCSSSTSA